ncbi:hypothetical protein LWI29_016270 [Acer saccharum]|uniref:Thaumatin-like protein n=1 Tax=Acer saccharum TaxID=4024 RepID=A0AA39SNE7_ACESA|nr:hypothetical protein LWI29_016270 [Acer saccharum]
MGSKNCSIARVILLLVYVLLLTSLVAARELDTLSGQKNASGRFTYQTADCGSGQVTCNGAGAAPPASLVEFTIAANSGQDFNDVSLIDGFNLPVSITPQGDSGPCSTLSCSANVNGVCPSDCQSWP